MDEINIVSLNVRGLCNTKKCKELFNLLKRKQFDIICLQETHTKIEDEQMLKMIWQSELIFAHGSTKSCGVAILFSRKIMKNAKITNITCDSEGRYVCANVTIHGQEIGLINMYGPNEDNPTFFHEISKQAKEHDTSELILIGDYNIVLDPKLDRTEVVHYHPKSCTVLAK